MKKPFLFCFLVLLFVDYTLCSPILTTQFYKLEDYDHYDDYDVVPDTQNEVEDEPGFWQELQSQLWDEIEKFFKSPTSRKIRALRM